MRAILVGGTSHVGKSTFAAQLSERLGWDVISTDRLARHPGRPWRDKGAVPPHVREYFSKGSDAVLLDDVTRHFEKVVWPIVAAIVRARILNAYDNCLIVEGSAILPRCVSGAALSQVKAVWLTVSDDLIVERMRANSCYADRTPDDRVLIDKFLARTLAFNRYHLAAADNLGVSIVDVSDATEWNKKLEELAAEGGGT